MRSKVSLGKSGHEPPSGDSTRTKQVGLHDRNGTRARHAPKRFHAEFALTGRERNVRCRCQAGVAFQIVLWERLLEPVQTIVLHAPDQTKRTLDRQSLVGIYHQFAVRYQRPANRVDTLDVSTFRRAADLDLDTAEAPGNVPAHLVGEFLVRVRDPSAAAVDGNGAERSE